MAEPSPSTKGAPSVLIVDDHELVGTSLAVALTAEGLRARRAAAVDLVGVLKEAASLPARAGVARPGPRPGPAGAAA